jgi:hypothetical protein
MHFGENQKEIGGPMEIEGWVKIVAI